MTNSTPNKKSSGNVTFFDYLTVPFGLMAGESFFDVVTGLFLGAVLIPFLPIIIPLALLMWIGGGINMETGSIYDDARSRNRDLPDLRQNGARPTDSYGRN